MVGIIDYGMGNLLSVYHALQVAGAEACVCVRPEDLQKCSRFVLPGVGAFRDCMRALRSRGFSDALTLEVCRRGKPILGICLGMQAMAARSFEGGEYPGLGWFDADVVRLEPDFPGCRIPHIGWNEAVWKNGSVLATGIPVASDFYFVHSYYMHCRDDRDVEAISDYGGTFTAAVRKNNIFATQFHPEKSQDQGLKALSNFVQWNP
ncbi:MAG: imidazole glycerol phosphate synthase subunit HisH [Acidobacteria bacterium]|nr:imidazole glycerol phosphate synthase subunit HisH [Acidobacteriota bacterium]